MRAFHDRCDTAIALREMFPGPDPRHLFVYGTLMRASRSPYAQLLNARAQFVGEAWTAGRLYLLGRYPGAVFGDDCAGRVYGELFLLRGGTLLAALDAYERCSGQGEKSDLFYRDVVEVQRAQGERLRAWGYPFIGAVRGRPLIASGRFPECVRKSVKRFSDKTHDKTKS